MATATVGILRVLFSGNSAEWEAAAKRASGTAQVLSKDLGQIGRQATAIGGALTKTLTLPLLALGAGSVKAAMDFESSFANVAKTVEGLSNKFGVLTPKGAALAQVFRDMAKEIPVTTDELNKIAALGGQMGVPIEQLAHFTRNVAALSVAVDGISAEEAAAGLAQIGNATGTGTTKIAEMASALVHLGNNSNATEADILEFTKRLVGAGHSAGMTVPEVMAIGTAMANVGINAEAGGTAMSTVIAKIGKAVSENSTQLKEFAAVSGKSAEEFAAVWKRSSAEGIDLFVKGLSTMRARGVDLNLTMGELGTEGIRVASTLKLLAGAGDGVSKSIALANEGFGAGNKHLEEAEKKYATTEKRLKLLANHIMDVGVVIGNALLPAMKSLISMLTALMPIVEGIAHAFAALPGPVQGIVVGLGLVLIATGPVIWAFGQLSTSASILIGAFGKKGIAARLLAASLGTTTTAANATALSFNAMATGSTTAAVGVGGLTAALGTALFWSGIGIAIGGIAFGIFKVVGAIKDASKALSEGRFWEFFTAQDKDNWLRAGLGMSTSNTSPPKPLATMPAYAADAEFATAVLQSQELAAQTKKLAAAMTTSETGVKTLGDKLDVLSASVKAADKEIAGLSGTTKNQLTAAFKSGAFSIEELKKETGLSEIVLERFKKSLEASASSHKKAEKAASDQEKQLERLTRQLEKQRDALQKLGIVTEDTVNDALRDFMVLISSAGPGVPMDRLLAALVPKLEDLKKQADASGISVRALDENLRVAKEALARLTAEATKNIPSLPIVDKLETLPGTMVAISTEGELTASALTESFHHFGLKTKAELQQTARDAEVHFEFIRKSGVATPEQIAEAFEKMRVAQRAAGIDVESVWTERLKILGTSLKNISFQAGHSLATVLGEGIRTGDWSQLENNLKDILSEAIGSSIAAAVDFLVPGLGTMLKPLFSAIADKLLGALGLGTRGRDLVKEFAATFEGGFDELHAKLAALGEEGDRLWKTLTQGVGKNNPQQAQAAIDAINAALGRAEERSAAFNASLGGLLGKIQELGTGLPDSLREYLSELERGGKLTQENIDLLHQLSGQGEADWKKIQEAVGRYGGDISKLGGTFQAQRLHESWQQIIDDVDLFQRGNISANDILDLTKAKIIEVAQESIRFGTEIPENMRPWIQRLIDSGELIDDSGQKITDIGKLTFGETLQTTLALLTDEIKRLIETLGGVPAAAQTAAQGAEKAFRDVKPEIRVGIVYDDPGAPIVKTARTGEDDGGPRFEAQPVRPPGYGALGGLVTPFGIQHLALGGVINAAWKRGSDTQHVMATPGEILLTEGQQGNIASALHDAMSLVRAGALTSGRSEWDASALSREESRMLQSVTIMEIDKREIGRAVADVLPGELRRLGVRVRA